MGDEWISKILPIINAAGIPLLSFGLLVLILAYRRAMEAYKDSTTSLLEENKRLRDRLREMDSDYFENMNKVKEMVSKSIDAIAELQARKVELLAKPENAPKELVLSDVERINRAIIALRELSGITWRVKIESLERTRHLEEMIKEHENEISRLADQISDNTSKVIVIGVLTTDEAYQKHKLDKLEGTQGLAASEAQERLLP